MTEKSATIFRRFAGSTHGEGNGAGQAGIAKSGTLGRLDARVIITSCQTSSCSIVDLVFLKPLSARGPKGACDEEDFVICRGRKEANNRGHGATCPGRYGVHDLRRADPRKLQLYHSTSRRKARIRSLSIQPAWGLPFGIRPTINCNFNLQ